MKMDMQEWKMGNSPWILLCNGSELQERETGLLACCAALGTLSPTAFSVNGLNVLIMIPRLDTQYNHLHG